MRQAREWPRHAIADADEVAVRACAGGAVDSRTRHRYEGEAHPLDERRGHVPGAVSLPYTGSLDDADRFLSAPELADRFRAVGVDSETVYYSVSGVSACVNALAAERAGLGRGRLYVGSWSGWVSDPHRPAVVGGKP